LLDLPRSSFYYEPLPTPQEDLELMRQIDELWLKRPYFGSRRIAQQLGSEDQPLNRKRVQRLMRTMGIEAIHPRRKTTITAPGHRLYPYLLRELTIDRPNQVWCSDITYIPMEIGFMYLVAVMDWYSRYVLAWELSNTLDAEFCILALRTSLTDRQPVIFNTDQGSQFTCLEFTSVLDQRGIAISMDGRGRALDNVFIERLWRSLKYEDIYLKSYTGVDDLYGGLSEWFTFYNHKRRHQGLNGQTPCEAYRSRPKKESKRRSRRQ
jgi:putative transposase